MANTVSAGLVDDRRYCWVCFATDEEDSTATWLQPCRCRGTSRWVHESCLQRWIDEKQKGNALTSVYCPQCNTEYLIVFPPMGRFILVLDVVNQIVYRVCPFVAAGCVIGAIYWTAVTYGALTVMQVVGTEEALTLMEQADPLFLLVGLPTIPILLILGRLVHWEEALLKFLNRTIPRFPVFKYILPSFRLPVVAAPSQGVEIPPLSDPVSATRVVCGAIVFPSMAVLLGKLLFNPAQSSLKRAFLGGLTFVALKGFFKIYYRHQTHVRQCRRRVLDFPSEETRSSTQGDSTL